jgi:GNAT superfamily N-acetyltransferase
MVNIEDYRKVSTQSFREAIMHLMPQLVPGFDPGSSIREIYKHSNTHILIAMEDSQPIGIVEFVFSFRLMGPLCYIEYLIVDGGHRNRGIGKLLLSKVYECAKNGGYPKVSLFSEDHRDEAHRFYIKNGYAKGSDVYAHFSRNIP